MESRGLRIGLRIWVGLVLAFLFVPIILIMLYAFDRSVVESWPISGFTFRWFSIAWHDPQVRAAFILSVKVAVAATAWPGQGGPARQRGPGTDLIGGLTGDLIGGLTGGPDRGSDRRP